MANPIQPVTPPTPGAPKAPPAAAPAPQNSFLGGLQKKFETAKQYNNVLGKYNVPANQRLTMMGQAQELQNSYDQGHYLNAYHNAMGLIGGFKQHAGQGYNPSHMADFMRQQNPNSWSPTMWHALNAWHGMVGTPQAFANTMGGLAPELLGGVASTAGAPGLLGAYGLLSGNRDSLNALKTLFVPHKLTPQEQAQIQARKAQQTQQQPAVRP